MHKIKFFTTLHYLVFVRNSIFGLLGQQQHISYSPYGTHFTSKPISFKVQLFIALSTLSCLELADGLLYEAIITLSLSSSSSSSHWMFTGDKVLAIQTPHCTEIVKVAWALERKLMHQDVWLAELQW